MKKRTSALVLALLGIAAAVSSVGADVEESGWGGHDSRRV
jgi:hypothetical protein